MSYQVRLPMPLATESTRIGIAAHLTDPPLQQQVFKELINKFAWALGSTYRLSYSQRRSNVRLLAQALAKTIIENEGYPLAISK